MNETWDSLLQMTLVMATFLVVSSLADAALAL